MVRCAPSDSLRASSLHLAAFSSYFSILVWRFVSITPTPHATSPTHTSVARRAGRKDGERGEILRKRRAADATARASGQCRADPRALPDHRIDEAVARVGVML